MYAQTLTWINTLIYMQYMQKIVISVNIRKCTARTCLNVCTATSSPAHWGLTTFTPSVDVAQRKYFAFREQCLCLQKFCLLLTCYFKGSGEFAQAPLFHNFLSLWQEQLAYLCTGSSSWNTQDLEGGLSHPFPGLAPTSGILFCL